MIAFDGEMPFSVEQFMENARRLLSVSDSRDAMIALRLESGEAHNAMLKTWQDFERALKNEIAVARAVQRQQNPVNVVRGERMFDQEITGALTQASKAETPMDAEKILMRLQWNRLDELSLNKGFSIEFILAYAVKLKILERLNAFKSEEGGRKLEHIMAESAQELRST